MTSFFPTNRKSWRPLAIFSIASGWEVAGESDLLILANIDLEDTNFYSDRQLDAEAIRKLSPVLSAEMAGESRFSKTAQLHVSSSLSWTHTANLAGYEHLDLTTGFEISRSTELKAIAVHKLEVETEWSGVPVMTLDVMERIGMDFSAELGFSGEIDIDRLLSVAVDNGWVLNIDGSFRYVGIQDGGEVPLEVTSESTLVPKYTLGLSRGLELSGAPSLRTTSQSHSESSLVMNGSVTNKRVLTLSCNSPSLSFLDELELDNGRPLVRQRMSKNGAWSQQTPPAQVTSWTSDATYPATITSDSLIVTGTGTGTLTCYAKGGNGNGNNYLELRVNGVAVATGYVNSSVTATLTTTRYFSEGAVISLWSVDRTGNGRTVNADTYIELAPALASDVTVIGRTALEQNGNGTASASRTIAAGNIAVAIMYDGTERTTMTGWTRQVGFWHAGGQRSLTLWTRTGTGASVSTATGYTAQIIEVKASSVGAVTKSVEIYESQAYASITPQSVGSVIIGASVQRTNANPPDLTDRSGWTTLDTGIEYSGPSVTYGGTGRSAPTTDLATRIIGWNQDGWWCFAAIELRP